MTANDDLMDMMVDDASSSTISDKIKEILYAKTAEKVDAFADEVTPMLCSSPFSKILLAI